MRARLWALLGRLIPDDLFDCWLDDEGEYVPPVEMPIWPSPPGPPPVAMPCWPRPEGAPPPVPMPEWPR
jgi:hypothetical protein